MAKKNLIDTLEKLNIDLEKSSEAYRTLVSNKEAHYIVLNKKEVKAQLRKQLAIVERDGRFQNLTKGIENAIEQGVDIMFDDLAAKLHPSNFESGRRKYLTSNFSNTGDVITVVLETKEGRKPGSVFNYFRRIKQQSQKELVKKLNAEITKLNSDNKNKREEIRSSDLLDIGHIGSSAVSLQRKAAVQEKLYSFSQKQNKQVQKFLKEIADTVDIKLKKVPPKKKVGGKEVIEITLESSRLNKEEGRKKLAKLAGDLNKKLEEAVNKVNAQDWAGQKGSASYLDRVEQDALNEFAKIKGKKNFKKKNLRKATSSAKISKKTKSSKGAAFKDNRKAPGAVNLGTAQDKQQSSIQLMGLLNAKLPRVVANNMGFPRLENVSGRFASSVRVTDISRTPQGFPSIGYTYQRNPYGVYEASSGTRFSSVDRDPRPLIDASIREIAVELITTRLYTRRM